MQHTHIDTSMSFSAFDLQVIQSDFARLQAETESAEEAAKKEYNEFMEDSKALFAIKQPGVFPGFAGKWWVGCG